MKNKLLTGVVIATLIAPCCTNAKIVSSKEYTTQTAYDECNELMYNSDGTENMDAWDACMTCFFWKDNTMNPTEFRRKGEIKFNTETLICSDQEQSTYEYLDTVNDCNAILTGMDADNCYYCLVGRNNEIAHIDEGDDQYGGVVYLYDKEGTNHQCIIEDSSLLMCAAGWYGFPYDDGDIVLSSCLKCPGDGATTSPTAGKITDITKCYIPADIELNDGTGTYKYYDDCYYTK